MILHTLNASPASRAFSDCLRVIAGDDALLLMGDGVYAAIPGTAAWGALQESGAAVYVLDTDASAAGISELADSASRVDMAGFVALTERFVRQQAWY
jgi:tRNA 2-thiouridine synthesizing protein B